MRVSGEQSEYEKEQRAKTELKAQPQGARDSFREEAIFKSRVSRSYSG